MSRQSGYYWVKYFGDWHIAEFISHDDSEYWLLTGYERCHDDCEIQEINETRILAPDEVSDDE